MGKPDFVLEGEGEQRSDFPFKHSGFHRFGRGIGVWGKGGGNRPISPWEGFKGGVSPSLGVDV